MRMTARRAATARQTRKITAATEICVELIEGVCYLTHKRLNEEGFVAHPVITKYGFRICTRSGLIVDNLLIHGRDEVDAERKLRQMYRHCRILQCTVHKPGKNAALTAAS
jgi:hypothetical protein